MLEKLIVEKAISNGLLNARLPTHGLKHVDYFVEDIQRTRGQILVDVIDLDLVVDHQLRSLHWEVCKFFPKRKVDFLAEVLNGEGFEVLVYR